MAQAKFIMSVSVVVTVFNEQTTIDELLSGLKNQSLSPREVIIVDGGSTDNTWDILQSWINKLSGLRVFRLENANRSMGRNFAVSKSKSKIIAFTDAGCFPGKNWLKELTKSFSDPAVQIVSGYYQGRAKNIFESCLIPYVLVMPDKASKTEFFPSTRSMAMTRNAWDKSGGFDPKLNYNEDFAFAHWLKQIGFTFHFAPLAVVEWFPRKNLSEAAKMFYYFSVGDIQARIFRPKVKMLLIRYLVLIFVLFLALENHIFIFLIIPAVIAYLIWSVVKNYRYVQKPIALFWLPVIQITADLMVIIGTLSGLMLRAYGLF